MKDGAIRTHQGVVHLDLSAHRNVPRDRWQQAIAWAAAESYRVTTPSGLGACRLYEGEGAAAYEDILRLHREAGWHYLLTVGQTADGLTESLACEAGEQWAASGISFGVVLFTKEPATDPRALQDRLARVVASLEEEWLTIRR